MSWHDPGRLLLLLLLHSLRRGTAPRVPDAGVRSDPFCPPVASTCRGAERMSLPEGFTEGCGRRRFEFLRLSLYNDLGLHLPELPEDRRTYLAEQFTARILRDERDALTAYGVPRA